MGDSSCALPESLKGWSLECIEHTRQLVQEGQTLLATAEEDWKKSTMMNAKGFAEGLAEAVGDSVDVESFDPRSVLLARLEDMLK